MSGASAWDDVIWVMKCVSFAAEGSRRSKPVKSRLANFSRKEEILLLGYSGCGKKQVSYMGCSGRSFAVEGSRRGKPLKSRVANCSKKKGTLLLGFSGCGKKQVMVMYGM